MRPPHNVGCRVRDRVAAPRAAGSPGLRRCAACRRMTKGKSALGPLLPRRARRIVGGDEMTLPAGRRQELAGLLLARAFARDPGGVASGL